MKTYFVYQAYGRQDILNECAFSIITLLKQYPDSNVVVYSDNKVFFTKIFGERVEIVPIDNQIIQRWKGNIDFVHRVKIEVLLDFFEKYQAHCFYVDSDTIFTGSPEQTINGINKHEIYMHVKEGVIKDKINPIFKKMYKFLKQHTDVPVTSEMWNAGMIGIHNDYKNKLIDVLNLTDKWFKIYPKHVIEQFAFSYVLQCEKPIKATEHYIHHFWDFKEFRSHIDQFFDSNPNKSYLELMELELPDPVALRPKPETFLDKLKKIFS